MVLPENFLKLCFFGSCDFNFNFFKNAPNYIHPYSGHFVLNEIFCGSNFYYSFFSIIEKLNISVIYKSIILIFSVNNQVNLENTIRVYVWQGTLKLKFNARNSHNFWVNLPIVFIYLYFVRKKFNSNHQENLENIV